MAHVDPLFDIVLTSDPHYLEREQLRQRLHPPYHYSWHGQLDYGQLDYVRTTFRRAPPTLCTLPPEVRRMIRAFLHPIHRIRMQRLCHFLHDEDPEPCVDPANWCLHVFDPITPTRDQWRLVRELVYSGLHAEECPHTLRYSMKNPDVDLHWSAMEISLRVDPGNILRNEFEADWTMPLVDQCNDYRTEDVPLDHAQPLIHARVALTTTYKLACVRATRQHINDALAACHLFLKEKSRK